MRLRDGALLGYVLQSGEPPSAAPLVGVALLALGLLVAGLATRLAPGTATALEHDSTLGVLGVAAALTTLLVARDLSTSIDGDVPGSARLLHLVTYNYKRSWPATLDFEAAQWGFGVATDAVLAGVAGATSTPARGGARQRDRGLVLRLHALDLPARAGSALRSTRAAAGLLPGASRLRRACRCVPDELEGRKLLHR
jgi:hypothetical protein